MSRFSASIRKLWGSVTSRFGDRATYQPSGAPQVPDIKVVVDSEVIDLDVRYTIECSVLDVSRPQRGDTFVVHEGVDHGTYTVDRVIEEDESSYIVAVI